MNSEVAANSELEDIYVSRLKCWHTAACKRGMIEEPYSEPSQSKKDADQSCMTVVCNNTVP